MPGGYDLSSFQPPVETVQGEHFLKNDVQVPVSLKSALAPLARRIQRFR